VYFQTLSQAFLRLTDYICHMYIMKVKGTARIPDYVQIRDDNFTLIAYFRADRPEKELQRLGLQDKETTIVKRILEIPYGKISPLNI
jgi:hypothetical protein